MSKREYTYIIMMCFDIRFIIFKGTGLFDVIHSKFTEIQEKLYDLNKGDRYVYDQVFKSAKSGFERISISVAMEYVNTEDIRNYISKEKEKSYNEGYDEHRKRLREVFGLSK